ncbi:MAG: transaldolase [Gammaproteobacteria bacterium]|nr:transaldolase [Gammaproteobacteria bacterium]
MSTTLDWLRSHSIVVADTAVQADIERYQPIDATTNPSLVYKAVQDPALAASVQSIRDALASGAITTVADAAERLAVSLGVRIAQRIPGFVSTEVDARFSYDTDASIQAAKRIIQLYANAGIAKERILIKLAATWEGISACRQLEAEGIQCNLTLIFSDAQALAAARAQATLISPFVGRIYDWFIARQQIPSSAAQDPGVMSVQRIHRLYKSHGVRTIIMGASFRTVDQVLALAGCDRLTISPDLLGQLAAMDRPVHPMPHPTRVSTPLPEQTRNQFMLALAADPMATEKLADGITRFVADQMALEALLAR